MYPPLGKTLLQQPLKRVRESPAGKREGLQEDAGPTSRREARQEADPVLKSSPECSPPRGRSPTTPGRSEGPRRGEPEVPELDGAPQREPSQHMEERGLDEVVNGPVASREAPAIDREFAQDPVALKVRSTEAKEADIPGRGGARPGGGSRTKGAKANQLGRVRVAPAAPAASRV